MRTLRGRFFITDPPGEFQDININKTHGKSSKKDYYTMDRGRLRKKIIESGVYTEEEFNEIEKEGCRKVVGNSLTMSPFSGYRYYFSAKFPEQILKGLKILMGAVAADSADIVVPLNTTDLVESFEKIIKKSPNLFMYPVKDRYPLSYPEILHKKLYGLSKTEKYFPGIEGVLITSVEELYRIYLQVEDPHEAEKKYITVLIKNNRFFIKINANAKIAQVFKILNLDVKDFVIKGDLLTGEAVCDINIETVENISQIFIISDTGISLSRCMGCGRCLEVCPVKLEYPHSRQVLYENKGLFPLKQVGGCAACGLCGYFCPGWKT